MDEETPDEPRIEDNAAAYPAFVVTGQELLDISHGAGFRSVTLQDLIAHTFPADLLDRPVVELTEHETARLWGCGAALAAFFCEPDW